MVNSESEVVPSPLPSPIFYNSDLQFDASSDSDIEPVVLHARPSRASFDADAIVNEGDTRERILEEGVVTYEVREKRFEQDGNSTTLARGPYRTGTGKVVLACPSVFRRLQCDFVTVTQTHGRMWHNDRAMLRQVGFSMACSVHSGDEAKAVHLQYYGIFAELPIVMVTAFQGYRA